MLTFTKYILINILRKNLAFYYLGFIVVIFLLSLFAGHLGIVEQDLNSSAFFLSIMKYTNTLFISIVFSNLIDNFYVNKEIDFIVSFKDGRKIIISGFFFSALISTVIVSVITFLFGSLVNADNTFFILTSVIEMVVISFFCIAVMLISKNQTLAIIGSFAYLILAKISGFIILMINNQLLNNYPITNFKFIFSSIFNLISIIVPRFDILSNSNNYMDIVTISAHGISIILFIIFMTYHDFKKKSF